jgi:hypothetical protein
MRINQPPHRLMQVSNLIDQLRSSKHGAGQNVVMSGEIFRAALQNKIHTEFDWSLIERSGKRAVDKRQNFMLICNLFNFNKVENIQIGIRRRLGKDKTCVFFNGPFKNPIISERNDGTFNSELFQIRAAKFKCLLIAVVRYHNMVAGLDQCQNRRCDGAHAGGKYNAVFGAFKVGKPLFRDFCRRIAISAVFEMFFALSGKIFDVLRVPEGKRRGLNDRGCDRIGVFSSGLARMDGPRGKRLLFLVDFAIFYSLFR